MVRRNFLPIFLGAFLCGFADARFEGDKYDLRRLSHDLKPVRFMVGKWKLTGTTGTPKFVKPPAVFDFGINPIPMFGARVLNITGHYFNRFDPQKTENTMYGFMPVRNATKRDPRVHTALITTYSQGINMIEQGQVYNDQKIRYHLKQFMKRSFGLGDMNFVLNKMERQFHVTGNQLRMRIHSETNLGIDNYEAAYWKFR